MFPVNVLLCCQILNEDKVDSRLLRESLTALSPGILISRYFLRVGIGLLLGYVRPDPWQKKKTKALYYSLLFTDERDRHKTR